MRKLYLFLVLQAFVCTTCLYSQTVLTGTHNLPRHGDRLVKQQVNYVDPGEKGLQVLWDFSQLLPVDENYELSYTSVSADSITGREHSTLYYYLSRGDSLLLAGYENNTTLMNYICPEPILVFPFMYGRSSTDYFLGTGNYCNRLHIHVKGKSTIQADAAGRLVLPGGDTITHVIRVHTLKKMTEQMHPYTESGEKAVREIGLKLNKDSVDYHLSNDSIRLEVESWRWYADGYRYPVFESIKSTVYRFENAYEHFTTSFYYPPREQYYELAVDSDNLNRQNELDEQDNGWNVSQDRPIPGNTVRNGQITYHCYYDSPQNLLINYNLAQQTELSFALYDLLGRLCYREAGLLKGEGQHQHSISLNACPAGEYLLLITAGKELYTEKILKK